jgi:hypothetical protein
MDSHKAWVATSPLCINDEKEEQSQNTTVIRWCPFIKQTTCFGPCTGPSSGVNLCIGGVYRVRVFSQKSGSYRVNEIPLLCITVIKLINTGLLWHKMKVKRKMLPVCLPWRYIWGSGGIATPILKLGTRLDWVLSLTLCPIHVWGKSPQYTSNTRLDAAWSQFWCQVNQCAFQDKTLLCVIFARHFAHFPNAKCGKLTGGWWGVLFNPLTLNLIWWVVS